MALTLPEKLLLGSSDLRFLLTNHRVKDDHQGKLFENGIDTLALHWLSLRPSLPPLGS